MKTTLGFVAAMAALVLLGGCAAMGLGTPAPATPAGYVKGVITAKGSIWVNGVEYQTTGSSVTVDGSSTGTDADLKVGMTVEFNASVDASGKATVKTVAYESGVKGLVEVAGDLTTGQFTVLGQVVQTGLSTVIEGAADVTGVTVGKFVEVSGQLDATNVLVATRVEVKSFGSGDELKLKGEVSALDTVAKTFVLTLENAKTYTIDYSTAAADKVDSALANKSKVRVKFATSPAGSTITATSVTLKKQDVKPESGSKGELEGIVSSYVADPLSFTLDGTPVSATGDVASKALAAGLADGKKVGVKGDVGADGVLVATKIEVQKSDKELKGDLKEFDGAVTAVDITLDTFAIDSTTYYVTSKTIFHDKDWTGTDPLAKLGVGDQVEGKALKGTDGMYSVIVLEKHN
ncbi:MAG: DUF5666 domain-containing protein [Spirochaetales bacterium]